MGQRGLNPDRGCTLHMCPVLIHPRHRCAPTPCIFPKKEAGAPPYEAQEASQTNRLPSTHEVLILLTPITMQ